MANYATSALKLSDTYVNTLPYNTCSTAAGTAAKTVSAGTFSLETGAMVVVKFTTANTAANPTLNVSSTGAKAIYYNGEAISKDYLKANKVYQFIYNGTQWDLVGDTYSDMTGATSSAAGKAGLVPAPAAGKQASFLRGDGTWVVPTDTKYTHPTTAGNKHIPSGGASGQILKWSADGTAAWGDESSGTSIESGPYLPAAGNEGDVFLKTSMAGQQYTETITVSGTGIYTLTYPIASTVSIDYPDSNYPSFSVSNGALKIEGDWYSEGEVTITYVVGEGAESSNTYPKPVFCSITSFGSDISNTLIKGVDNGSMITLYLDYSLSSSGEESFSFGSEYADKTVLGIYALTESGIAPYDTTGVSGPPQLTSFTPGQALSNGFYFVDTPTRLRENVAVIIIYYV